ncbi:MAG: hypothetical protein HYV16_09830 [Gammaproteobacteria bacterium]|nr:hypothetical protein [Gammaproteobacteria bacterium]
MTIESPVEDSALQRQAKTSLDEHAEHLDLRTQMRLAAVRQRALGGARRPARKPAWLWGGALAVAASLVLALNLSWRQAELPEAALFEDLEMLSAGEPDALLEDPEFYAWLAEDGDAAGG